MWPYAASALAALRLRLPRMPRYYRHCVAIADAVRDLPGVEVLPYPVQSTLMHVRFSVELETLRERVAEIGQVGEGDDLRTALGVGGSEAAGVRVPGRRCHVGAQRRGDPRPVRAPDGCVARTQAGTRQADLSVVPPDTARPVPRSSRRAAQDLLTRRSRSLMPRRVERLSGLEQCLETAEHPAPAAACTLVFHAARHEQRERGGVAELVRQGHPCDPVLALLDVVGQTGGIPEPSWRHPSPSETFARACEADRLRAPRRRRRCPERLQHACRRSCSP